MTFTKMAITNSIARALIGEGRCLFIFQPVRERGGRIFPRARITRPKRDQRIFPRHRAMPLRLIGYYDLDLRHFLSAMETNIMFAKPPPLCLRAAGYWRGLAKMQRNAITSSPARYRLGGAIVREVEGRLPTHGF